jgi:hypothetical protein
MLILRASQWAADTQEVCFPDRSAKPEHEIQFQGTSNDDRELFLRGRSKQVMLSISDDLTTKRMGAWHVNLADAQTNNETTPPHGWWTVDRIQDVALPALYRILEVFTYQTRSSHSSGVQVTWATRCLILAHHETMKDKWKRIGTGCSTVSHDLSSHTPPTLMFDGCEDEQICLV